MIGNSGLFNRTDGLRPGRSVFDLSYEVKGTMDMGQLIPIFAQECVPGDTFKVGNQIVVRFQPLVTPTLHEIKVHTHYYFVPYRILWDEFEQMITGGEDGLDATPIPKWKPTNVSLHSLWDYFGFPIDFTVPSGSEWDHTFPVDFPRRAYNFIYNEYYRDQNLMDEVDWTNEDVLYRLWYKDYFTTALPWQQRGIAPAIPVSGTGFAQFTDDMAVKLSFPPNTFLNGQSGEMLWMSDTYGKLMPNLYGRIPGSPPEIPNTVKPMSIYLGKDDLSNNEVLINTSGFTVSDLRLAFQVQKWQERNARAGVRYTEFLKSHFGTSPSDARLQRPEYIGGTKSPIIMSEVLQTSSTDATSPQGTMAGHGMSAAGNFAGSYTADEYGIIIGLMSIMPDTVYQDGIHRQWLKDTRYDFFFPEFAHLSEQEVRFAEIRYTGTDKDNEVFGFQGRYNEMRYNPSRIVGYMRSGLSGSLDFWHLARHWDRSSPPELNEEFLLCKPDKRIFAVLDEPGIIFNVANTVKAIRPLPYTAEPGLIDHF